MEIVVIKCENATGGNKPNEMKIEEGKMEPSSEFLNSERRRHRRFSVALPIEYWQMDKSRSRPGQTINISEGGLLLQLSEPLEIGQVLGLTLFITSGPDLDAIEAVAQVEVSLARYICRERWRLSSRSKFR